LPQEVCAHDPEEIVRNVCSSNYECVGLLEDVVALSSGEDHTCAQRSDGSVVCWGLAGAASAASADKYTVCTPTPGICRGAEGFCDESVRVKDSAVKTCDVVNVSIIE